MESPHSSMRVAPICCANSTPFATFFTFVTGFSAYHCAIAQSTVSGKEGQPSAHRPRPQTAAAGLVIRRQRMYTLDSHDEPPTRRGSGKYGPNILQPSPQPRCSGPPGSARDHIVTTSVLPGHSYSQTSDSRAPDNTTAGGTAVWPTAVWPTGRGRLEGLE